MLLLGQGRTGAPELLPALCQWHQCPVSRASRCRVPGWMEGSSQGGVAELPRGRRGCTSRHGYRLLRAVTALLRAQCQATAVPSPSPSGSGSLRARTLCPGSAVQGPCRALPVPSLGSVARRLSPRADPVAPGMLGCRRHALCCPPCSPSPQMGLPREVPCFAQVWRTVLGSGRCLSRDKPCATSSVASAPGGCAYG